MRHALRNLSMCLLCFATATSAHESKAPLYLKPANGNPPSPHIIHLHEQLFAAVQGDDFAGIKRLLSQGADINVIEDYSKTHTPLTYAAENGDVNMTKFLLAHGADPNGKGVNLSPLFWTVSNDQTDCARLLLRAGANAERTCVDSGLPIDDAASQGDIELVNMLIGRMPHLSKTQARKYRAQAANALLGAVVTQGPLEDVKMVVEAGANVNSREMEDSSSGFGSGFGPPLMRATTRGSLPILGYLLTHGAKANLRDDAGRTALMYLGENDPYYPQLVPFLSLKNKNIGGEPARLLLEHGANIEARDGSGMTALMYAALGNFRAVEVLLAHGAKVNARDGEGRTALHWAALWRAPFSIKVLLQHGAWPNVQDSDGATPLMLASIQPDPPSSQSRSQRAHALSVLRRMGANPRLKDKRGQTATDYSRTEDYDYVTAT